jgi:adenine phosphoribosyltransferase
VRKTYTIDIAGMKRDLPLFPITDDLYIGAFIIFGDVEITKHAATELLKRAPEYDIMFTAECKSIPLLYEMARQAGTNDYIVARKGPKLYMDNLITTEVDSITTDHIQTLCIGQKEIDSIKGKRVLVVDDVISTGESLLAMEQLVEKAGGTVVAKMAVLAEGDAQNRDDITYLAPLPLFNADGTVKE